MNHLDLIAERLASVDITVMKRSVTVRSKAPGSIRTGCYHHVKVTTVSAISWHVDGRRFVAFVDKSGRIRYRELWRHHEPGADDRWVVAVVASVSPGTYSVGSGSTSKSRTGPTGAPPGHCGWCGLRANAVLQLDTAIVPFMQRFCK